MFFFDQIEIINDFAMLKSQSVLNLENKWDLIYKFTLSSEICCK